MPSISCTLAGGTLTVSLERREAQAYKSFAAHYMSITALVIHFSRCTVTQIAFFGHALRDILGAREFPNLRSIRLCCGGATMSWVGVCSALRRVVPTRRFYVCMIPLTPTVTLSICNLAADPVAEDRLLGGGDGTLLAREAYLDLFPDCKDYETREDITRDVRCGTLPEPTLELLEEIDALLMEPDSTDYEIDRLCTKVEYGVLSPISRAQLYRAMDTVTDIETALADFKLDRSSRTLHDMLLSSRAGGNVGELARCIDVLVGHMVTDGYLWNDSPSMHAPLYEFIIGCRFTAVMFSDCGHKYFACRLFEALFADGKSAVEHLTFDNCDLTRFDLAVLGKGGLRRGALNHVSLLNNRPGVEQVFLENLQVT